MVWIGGWTTVFIGWNVSMYCIGKRDVPEYMGDHIFVYGSEVEGANQDKSICTVHSVIKVMSLSWRTLIRWSSNSILSLISY
ncbi:hypothetical protein QOZ95_001783 [Paenibacillus brasilensis]|uniref:Uncharacterized protein n=1 Tax=Paenibacillus brasilensis TaxID=128574 RepID=A0ABU0KW07_9BACL|nr:hypothetical protein [Paenibacillus brasilensis]